MQVEQVAPTMATAADAAGGIAPIAPMGVDVPVPAQLEGLLQAATTDLERALQLLTAPPRPSFHGHGPIQTASGLIASASGRLADALALVAGAADPIHAAIARHLNHAIGATLDANDLVHQILNPGVGGPPPGAQPAAAMLAEDALAHARMALAVSIGEP